MDFIKLSNDPPKGASLSGQLYLNKNEMTPMNIKQYITYVIQDSFRTSVMTTREILTSVAELRYSATESPELIENRVNIMLCEMQLEKCSDTLFGDDIHKGLSGGEKKRVCIAAKLLIDSPILLLDEPTSGLDSSTSFTIIHYLREYARKYNKIILTTIHQPSSNIYNLFDKLIILNQGGLIYQGLSGDEVSKYFSSKGFDMKVNYNPSDSLMRIIEHQNLKNKHYFIDEYKKEKEIEFINEIDNYLEKTQDDNSIPNITNVAIYSNFYTAFRVNFRDYGKTIIRNPQVIRIKIITLLYFAFLCVSIFWRLPDTLEGNRGKLGFLLFFTTSNFNRQVVSVVLVAPMEKKLLIEDVNSNLYGVAPYTIARQIIDTIINLLIVLIYTLLTYFLVGLKETVENYFIFAGVYLSFTFCAMSIGLVISCFIKTTSQGVSAFTITSAILYGFSGIVINPKNIPVWLSWLRFINPIFYCTQASINNEFKDGSPLGVNLYELYKENFDIWHCIVYFVGIGLILRFFVFKGLQLAVQKKI